MTFLIIYLIGFVVFLKPVFKRVVEIESYGKIDTETLVMCSIITLVMLLMWPIIVPGAIVWKAIEPVLSRIADDMNKAK